MRVADYITDHLVRHGYDHIFLVTGGGAMHLNDAIGRCPGLAYTCCHHEQACAIAAESYARITGKAGVINVTTGPGGINALNGVFGAWTDSVPLLVVSGQVKRATIMSQYDLPGLRQLGDQEADTIRLASAITKYAVSVTEPSTIRYHLERALYLAEHGRPGPVWVDVPVDVQSADVDPDTMPGYSPDEDEIKFDRSAIRTVCQDIVARFASAKRPVILAGTGVRIAGALDLLEEAAERLGVPVATAWTPDLMPTDHPHYCGRQGSIGDRAGNFTVQNSDVLMILGSRLAIRQVSYNWENFARHAYTIQVDVDPAEMRKPTFQPDMAVHCDAKVFLEELNAVIEEVRFDAAKNAGWLRWCKDRVAKYPVVQDQQRKIEDGRVNPYHFLDRLSKHLAGDDVVVCGDATACVVTFQTATIQRGQRVYSNSGCASMGYDLPASIGAAVARKGKRVICLAGDGSIQMNIQELQTVAHNRWPIKIFVLNNNGYLSMRLTQGNFFHLLIGEGPSSGVSFPNMVKLAEAYGIPSMRLDSAGFEEQIERALADPGPVLCEVMLDPDQPFEPKLSSRVLPDGRMVSAPLEDMFPFLSREELLENLLIPPLEH